MDTSIAERQAVVVHREVRFAAVVTPAGEVKLERIEGERETRPAHWQVDYTNCDPTLARFHSPVEGRDG